MLLPSRLTRAPLTLGLRYVSDICYPSILVTGQIMEAVLSVSTRPDQDRF